MQVLALATLRRFWAKHPPAQRPLRAWYTIADKSEWRSPADIKRQFGNGVDFVGDNRVIFDIGAINIVWSYTWRMNIAAC